jgi:CRISPR-associated protein Cas2
MFVVVSYDIEDDKRRTKIAQKLEDFGTRVQFSVFECILNEEKFSELKDELTPLIADVDSLRFYQLCDGCVKKINVFGIAEVTKDEEVYIV